jgi:hypothetical protein
MLYRFGAKIEGFGDSSIKTGISDEKWPKILLQMICALWAICSF